MNLAKIFEVVVSDILIASLISGAFMVISNKHADKNERQQEQMISELKENLKLQLEVMQAELKTFMSTLKDD